MIADSETNEILGVDIIGPEATELIAEAGSAMALAATPEAIAHIIHAHPSSGGLCRRQSGRPGKASSSVAAHHAGLVEFLNWAW